MFNTLIPLLLALFTPDAIETDPLTPVPAAGCHEPLCITTVVENGNVIPTTSICPATCSPTGVWDSENRYRCDGRVCTPTGGCTWSCA